jgi:hypothetical protein
VLIVTALSTVLDVASKDRPRERSDQTIEQQDQKHLELPVGGIT